MRAFWRRREGGSCYVPRVLCPRTGVQAAEDQQLYAARRWACATSRKQHPAGNIPPPEQVALAFKSAAISVAGERVDHKANHISDFVALYHVTSIRSVVSKFYNGYSIEFFVSLHSYAGLKTPTGWPIGIVATLPDSVRPCFAPQFNTRFYS